MLRTTDHSSSSLCALMPPPGLRPQHLPALGSPVLAHDAPARDDRPDAQALHQMALFSMLPLAELKALLNHASVHKCRRGEVIVQQGTTDNRLHVVLSGKAHAMRIDQRGREVLINVLQSGDYIGDQSLIDGLPHSLTARCETVCSVLTLPGWAVAQCLARSPNLAQTLIEGLVQRLRRAYRQIEYLALCDGAERVTRRLQDMAQLQGGQWVIPERICRQEMAKAIGASREMVSRIIKRLEACEAIQPQPDGSTWLGQAIAPRLAAAESGAARKQHRALAHTRAKRARKA